MPVAKLISPITKKDIRKLRVAAYCRVSSNSADQLNSYATQIRVYTKYIKSRPEWELVDIFADEGLSGMKADNRGEFQRMIQLCERREIDLIVTKSVARFARNVKESLAYVRKLKLLGVGVMFEKEGINTLAMGDEMLLNTFSAIAQEESQAISQNQRLSIVKRMERGEYVCSNAAYGFRLIDKELQIFEPEAEVVRWIFQAYLAGWSTAEISRDLNLREVPSKYGNKGTWAPTKITYILSNERYIGDCRYQKFFGDTTVPFKEYKNRGQKDMFYAKGTHSAIVDADSFSKVQTLLQQRKEQFGKADKQYVYPLTSRIRCSECGSFYHRKNKNGTIKWVCSKHNADTHACDSFYYSELRIYDALTAMVNKLRFGEDNIIGQTISLLETAALAYKRNNQAASEMSQGIAELNAKLLMLEQLRSKGYLAADVYQTQALEIKNQLCKLKTERSSMFDTLITEKLEIAKTLAARIAEIEEPLEAFDEKLIFDIIERIDINNRDEMTVTLTGGFRFTERL